MLLKILCCGECFSRYLSKYLLHVVFLSRALQFPPEGWLRMSIGNCGVTWLTIRPNGRVSLRGLGDTGHLPPELVTFN